MPKRMPVKMSIDELEKMLNSDDEQPIQILPNGEIRAVRKKKLKTPLKVLTMRENLGGEYAHA